MKKFLASIFIFFILCNIAEARNLYIFSASWCPPCRQLKVFMKNNPEYFDDFDVSIIDIDNYPEIAKKYGVKNIPTSILLDNGKEINRLIGYNSTYRNWLKNWSKDNDK